MFDSLLHVICCSAENMDNVHIFCNQGSKTMFTHCLTMMNVRLMRVIQVVTSEDKKVNL